MLVQPVGSFEPSGDVAQPAIGACGAAHAAAMHGPVLTTSGQVFVESVGGNGRAGTLVTLKYTHPWVLPPVGV